MRDADINIPIPSAELPQVIIPDTPINAIENGKIIDKSNELENVLRTNLFSFHVLNFCNWTGRLEPVSINWNKYGIETINKKDDSEANILYSEIANRFSEMTRNTGKPTKNTDARMYIIKISFDFNMGKYYLCTASPKYP